jgi:uncharacterized protein
LVSSFNLRTARLRPGEAWRGDVAIELEPLELGGQRYTPVPTAPVGALAITRLTSGLLFELAFDVALEGPCMRCLEQAAVELSVRTREYQASGSEATEETTTPYLADDRLDLSAWARDAIALELPEKILCQDECAGLCPGCGANLNVESCSCPPPELDPRLSKLAELRDRLPGD